MMTATQMARRFGLSRSTLLYYESIGLLRRPPRTEGNYRAYTDQDAARLEQICVYRKVGLSLATIRTVLDRPGDGASAVLQRRLAEIEGEVEALRGHQRNILRLLQCSRSFRRNQMITKDKWVAIMAAAGFSEADMSRWHAEFEKAAPAEHQEFLEFLHIPTPEITKIRAWSRALKTA
ncbi:MAG: MerR family transcriptional regulator [Acidobacteriota bacterium]